MIYLELLLGFLEVGLFSFGGAYAAIPLIRDVVLRYGWLPEETLVYFIGVAESTTGSILGPWVQAEKPVVENGGHGMIFDDFNGKTWLSIHSPNGSPLERPLLVPFDK